MFWRLHSPLRPVKILIVEDEPEMASALSRGLEEEDFEVAVCSSGQQGLDVARGQDFDVILLDVMLPDLDGFSVVEQIRQRSETPVLMLTARDALSDVVRGLDSGADDYLTKPFSFRELLSRIRAIGRRSGSKPKNVHYDWRSGARCRGPNAPTAEDSRYR